MVGAVAALVAQRPHDHARVVLVALDHTHAALHKSAQPGGVVRQFVIQRVAFDIGFIDHIHAIAVAQIVPASVVGIVAGADGVDIKLFHQFDIGEHGLFVDHLAAFVVVIVAVDAFDQHRLAVDEQLLAHNFDLAETDLRTDHFQQSTL